MDLAATIQHISGYLASYDIPNSKQDARLLVQAATDTTFRDEMIKPETPITSAHRDRIDSYVARRISGEPVHRILGWREFYGLTLHLSPQTLEPRPDTEILIEAVLPHARETVSKQNQYNILDIGTGTGAIALALLKEIPQALATASDISTEALQTAQQNAKHHRLDQRFRTVQSNYFEAISGQFDLIVSNPPYIPTLDIADLATEVRDHDPLTALDGGDDGLTAYKAIAENAAKHLHSNGLVGLEHGYDQREQVSSVFKSTGFHVISAHNDLSGLPRVLILQKLG